MLYELRTYYAVPGRMPNLLARFRDHTCALFEKNGIQNVGYWVAENDPNCLIYIVRHPDAAAMQANWDKFRNDPTVYDFPEGLATGTLLALPSENGSTIDATAHGEEELGSKTTLYINGIGETIHTSCSTPFRAGFPAPLDDPKGDPSPNWFVVSFRQK